MARNRTPSAVLKLTGAYKNHPEREKDRAGEPKDLPAIGNPPKSLTEAEAEIWSELVGYCAKGVLTIMDRPILEQTCMLMALMRDRDKSMTAAERGLLVKSLSLMGMTPSDRSRLNTHPAPSDKGADPWGKA